MSGFQRLEWAFANLYIICHLINRIRLGIIGRRSERNVRTMTLDELRDLIDREGGRS